MGNLDPYIDLSITAKKAGGPEALLQMTMAEGVAKGEATGMVKGVATGVAVSAAATLLVFLANAGVNFLVQKYTTEKPDELAATRAEVIAKAEARGWLTVQVACEMQPGLTLAVGDRFKAFTRNDDVILIEVEGREDNGFYVSGEQLQQISDFKLDDIEEI